MAADLRKMRDEDSDAAKVIEVATGLEGPAPAGTASTPPPW